ncbi:MAG TPA: FUSC family protein, partial [Candidatus Polarisedimenticolia bacterium]|nr:FUSC family protein [Candidatus Polarisedimenticolia bacterium]
MTVAELRAFLARELAPTPGRLGATLRVTLACLVVTIPVFTFRIPHALIAFVVIYLITQEDTALTVLGSVLGVAGVTLGIGAALLGWSIALDLPVLRIAFFAAFLFGGLFLKRALTLGPLGSAIGLPGAMVSIAPDFVPPIPEVLLEFVLWLWFCAVLGVTVNLAIQLLLSPGDPLVLLRRELDMRLRAVEEALERAAGRRTSPSDPTLATLAIAGMTRPAAMLRTAALAHPWARERRERLSGLITVVDRLVTAARALELTTDGVPGEGSRVATGERDRLTRAAEGCRAIRQSFAQDRRPLPGEWTPLAGERFGGGAAPLSDVERTLDEIALPAPFLVPQPSGKPPLFLPDAFESPEYVRFALKGTIAALICYLLFVGFDYPGIYTCVITVFVVALSTVGASNQKGVLRFGGAAVGGAIALFSLMYLFPNVESIAGFWLVFGGATAIAAWVNCGSPRISYGGYQIGLAFY